MAGVWMGKAKGLSYALKELKLNKVILIDVDNKIIEVAEKNLRGAMKVEVDKIVKDKQLDIDDNSVDVIHPEGA